MRTFLLVAAALLPAIVLCVYVYKKDRVEKEPISLLLKLLCLGALCCFPAAVAESIFVSGLDLFVNTGESSHFYLFLENFFCIALVEEGLKLSVLIFATRKNEEYNSLFDGIIYAVFVSLGFAALENILYVMKYGFGNAVMRAILSVPGHMFFAVIMGCFYNIWNINEKAARIENYYRSIGKIQTESSRFKSGKYMYMCLLMPMAVHGFYNFCCSISSWWSTVILCGFVVLMYIKCFGKINEISYLDTYSGSIVQRAIIREYPQLEEVIS